MGAQSSSQGGAAPGRRDKDGLFKDGWLSEQAVASIRGKVSEPFNFVKYVLNHVNSDNGKIDGPFAAGEKWSHVDTSIFQLIEGLRYAFPRRMKSIEGDYPRLVAARDAVAKIEGVATYLASEKRLPFNEEGIFRHYEELDGE